MKKNVFTVFTSISLAFGFPFFTTAQKYTITESTTIVDDYLHDLFVVGSKYVVINYASPHGAFSYKRDYQSSTATTYNEKLNPVYSVPIKALAGRTYQTGISTGQTLFMFSSDGQGGVHKSELTLADGNSIESADKIFSFSGEHFSFKKGSSPDSSLYFLVCESHDTKEKNNSYAGVIMDKEMKVVNKFSFSATEEREDVLSTEYLLNNSGTLVLINAVKQKTSKNDYTPIAYVVQQVGSNAKTSTSSLTGLPEGLVDHVAWQLVENELHFAGLLSKKKKSDFTSIITGDFDLAEKKLSNIRETEFAKADYLQASSDSYINDVAKSGIPSELSLLSGFYNKDGSCYLLYEVNNTRYYDAYGPYLAAGGAFGTRSQFGSRTDYTTGNIFVVKLNGTKQLEWLRVIGKNQLEPSGNKYVGPVYLKDSEDRIYLIFHDDVQNIQPEPQKKTNRAELEGSFRRGISLASVQIDKSGNMKKQFIFDNRDTDHYASPRDFVTKQNNQFIYTSYRYRNVGKSTYRLGNIVIR